MMVDYSKWNNYKDSDSEDNDEVSHTATPTVYTLDPNERVDIGPQGARIQMSGDSVSPTSSSGTGLKKSVASVATPHSYGKEQMFTWQQTRLDVSLKIIIPAPFVELMKQVPKRIGLMTLTLHARHFVVKVGELVFLDKQLAYDVTETDKDGDCAVDWEIKTLPSAGEISEECKELWVTMKKKSPIPNAVQWWRKVFTDDVNEIDVTKIAGRNIPSVSGGNASSSSGSSSDSAQTDSFQSVWNSAHEQFLKNIAKRPKVDVEISEAECEGSTSKSDFMLSQTSTATEAGINTANETSSAVASVPDSNPVIVKVIGDEHANRLNCRRTNPESL